MNNKRTLALIVLCVSVFLSSCATPHPRAPAALEVAPPPQFSVIRHDNYHIVAPGETLWRISRIYDVKVEDIMAANQIKTPQELEIGQKLLIPRAAPVRPIIPLYSSDKWKYIIIHHSATDEGSALFFNKAHYARGFWNGLGYHFVIDNGSKGKSDGQIEISPRWIKQSDGAHCKAGGMNHIGIGICLVGNFSKEGLSEKQLDSLMYLVNILSKYYRIPSQNILGHGQVPGAKTECPGKYFPWAKFRARLFSANQSL